jgi:mono/diheme cytochrome c family protein
MKNTILLSIFVFIFFASPGIAKENEIDVDKIKNAQAADSKSISNGRELFTERCSVCHGEKADGKGPSAESFDMTPWSFTDGTIDDISDGYLFQKIKNGGVWYEMPPFSLILKNNEIWDIINFLRSISNKS